MKRLYYYKDWLKRIQNLLLEHDIESTLDECQKVIELVSDAGYDIHSNCSDEYIWDKLESLIENLITE